MPKRKKRRARRSPEETEALYRAINTELALGDLWSTITSRHRVSRSRIVEAMAWERANRAG